MIGIAPSQRDPLGPTSHTNFGITPLGRGHQCDRCALGGKNPENSYGRVGVTGKASEGSVAHEFEESRTGREGKTSLSIRPRREDRDPFTVPQKCRDDDRGIGGGEAQDRHLVVAFSAHSQTGRGEPVVNRAELLHEQRRCTRNERQSQGSILERIAAPEALAAQSLVEIFDATSDRQRLAFHERE